MLDLKFTAIHDTEAFLQAYEAGERSFTGINLVAVNLSHLDLKGVDFSYAELSLVDLSGTNLRGADLSYATLHQTNLSGADLRGAMLIGTDLRHANLDAADLREADYDPETTHFPGNFDPVLAGMRTDRSP